MYLETQVFIHVEWRPEFFTSTILFSRACLCYTVYGEVGVGCFRKEIGKRIEQDLFMRKILKKAVILLVVFILALAGYFAWSVLKQEEDGTVYTSIEDADLPVVYMEQFGREMNCLYGFVEDNSRRAGRGDLTVLPQDRRLNVVFEDVDSRVKGIQYEIRSLDGERLVERTVLERWETQDGTVRAQLPIQNLLVSDREYRLTLTISTEEHPEVHYYTRIMTTENQYAESMLLLAEEFSEKTFQYDTARELTTYLESDLNADNSSLGEVTLKNNFEQLTWRSLGMQRVGSVSMHLKELQGIMGCVELEYVVSRTDETGKEFYYDVAEAFTMKWSPQRIYMMDYDRRVNQIFSGDDDAYSDKRILLGISDAGELQSVSDASGKYRAFVANRALWFYDVEKGESTKVFAFRKSEEDIRTSFHSHGVKILSVSEAGDVDFLVYGYMNRGNHEGTTGVAVYRYERDGNSLTERMYLPSSLDYESLRQDVECLSYLSGNQSLYLMMDHTVYAVDLTGKEYMVVADDLTEKNFAVSTDGSRIAWQDGEEIYDSRRLNVMDLETGKKDEIQFGDPTVIRLIGFVGNDLVYGLAHPGEQFGTDGRVVGIPMYAIEIMGTGMELETRYEKSGIYLSNVDIQDSRVHLSRVRKNGLSYEPMEEDTLVCNEEVDSAPLAELGHFADAKQGRLYFVQLDASMPRSRNIRVHVPKKAVAEENNTILLKPGQVFEQRIYRAYSRGHLVGIYADFTGAVQAANDGMGLVTEENGRVFWSRVNRSNARTIGSLREIAAKVPVIEKYLSELAEGNMTSSDGTELLDGRGLTLNQVLYFVFRGNPVVAYRGDGSYGLIYGYDAYNISCFWVTGMTEISAEKIGLNDAAAYFEVNGENDFICFLSAEPEA